MEKIWNEINSLEAENKKMRTANKRMQKTIAEKTKAINENGISIEKSNQKISKLLKLLEKKGGKNEPQRKFRTFGLRDFRLYLL